MTSKAIPVNDLQNLRVPFADNHISKLPKPTKQQTDEVKADFKKGIRCTICGAWHHPNVVHLDYVGHAALTDRLLDTDIEWSWEPLSLDEQGLPALDRNGGLWIRLTVCGVTRIGYGAADGKSGGDAIKEIIGDALRNAGMRFGAALDLWHKGDLHVNSDVPGSDEPQSSGPAPRAKLAQNDGEANSKTALKNEIHKISNLIMRCESVEAIESVKTEHKRSINQALRDWPELINGDPSNEDDVGLKGLIERRKAGLSEPVDATFQGLLNGITDCDTGKGLAAYWSVSESYIDTLDDVSRKRAEAAYNEREAAILLMGQNQ